MGVSSGTSLAAVAHLPPQIPDATRVLTSGHDTDERYPSVDALIARDAATAS
jgi:cysteine synthase